VSPQEFSARDYGANEIFPALNPPQTPHLCMKKERILSHALWIALPQADTNAQRENAPS
jgi:hypothetical protein